MFSSFFKRKQQNTGAGLPFASRENDVFLVSFPKSGNTWLRFLLGSYMADSKMDFYHMHTFMPDIHYNPKDVDKITDSPRFIKSHFPYRPEYRNVIYLVRDGRETAVSYYYFLRKMKGIPENETFSEYLNSTFFAGKQPYGHWNNHVFSWCRDHRIKRLLIVRYEDLLSDTAKEFRKILKFSGIEVDEARMARAIESSSFKSMKKDEESKPDFLAKLGMDSLKTQYGFVREGKTDSWKTTFTPEEAETFWKMYGDASRFLKYPK